MVAVRCEKILVRRLGTVTEEVNPSVLVVGSSLVPLHLLRLLDLALIQARSFGLRHIQLGKGGRRYRLRVLLWGYDNLGFLPVLCQRRVFPWGIG